MFMKYLTLVYAHLKWVLDFLLYYPFYKLHDSQPPIFVEEHSIFHHESTPGSEKHIDCGVCLCKIEGGEEIKVLRCDHVFHRYCFDIWVGLKNIICPQCKESVCPRRAIISEHEAQTLLFKFCSIRTDDRERWWLR
ncbi:probable E3 ubiquitin-protein ligase XERICO [Gastrolobium bilobum]|uniref:probable E3 ubiquitin-protein ligase XERICO n=1 Tax=Gastrolobium bilobum TaxID=150636 RepID=UPI002AAF38AF|nr:probable E3 ubiquitin-protein ligase XERICO [Gastrolobium bilobum]